MADSRTSSARYVVVHLRENGFFYAVGFFLMLGLKHYYSNASANDLRWMLAPLAWLVELLAGIQFQWDSYAGFVSHSREVIIAPACAGINFLIISFSTIYFTFMARLRGPAEKCGWIFICSAAAYLLTLCTNSVRILISIYLYGASVYGGWVTPERVHRLAGTVIYVTILVVTFLAAEWLLERTRRPGSKPSRQLSWGNTCFQSGYYLIAAPIAWYVLVTVIVPILNGALGRRDSSFLEHSAVILFICLGISVFAVIVKKRIGVVSKTRKTEVSGGQC